MPIVLAWLVRWVGFMALAGLVGSFVMDLVVLPPGTAELAHERRRLRALRLTSTGLLLLAGGGDLWLRAGTMSGGGPGIALQAIPTVLTRTHFGSVWIARMAGLLALLPLSVAISSRVQSLGALLALATALTVALTGHAAEWGDVSAAVAVDCLHVIGAMTWAGGLGTLAVVVLRHAARWPPSLLARVMRRFSRLAAWCLLSVALSGAYNAWLQVPTVAALWQTVYGRALAVKVLVVLGIVWWGAVNRYVILPRLGSELEPDASTLRSRLVIYVGREAVLAMLVFACTAVLVESPPARHMRHLEHHMAAPSVTARPAVRAAGR